MRKRNFRTFLKKWILSFVIAGVLLGIWYIIHAAVGNSMRVPSPYNTVAVLFALVTEGAFYYKTCAFLLRVFIGWLAGIFVGFLLSFAESDTPFKTTFARFRFFVVKLPVLPILLLFSSAFFRLPGLFIIIVSSFASASLMWVRLLEGHCALDKQLLLTARCNASFWNVFLYLRLPHLIPYISRGMVSSWSKAFGMGLLAEFVFAWNGSVGGSLKLAFDSLLSETLFALCILLCILGVFSRWIISLLAGKLRFSPRLSPSDEYARNGHSFPLVFDRISKTEEGKKLLDSFSYVFSNGKVTAVFGGDRMSREALLLIAAAVEKDDDIRYAFPPTAPALIMEDPNLIPNLTVRENILFANRAANMGKILKALSLTKEADLYPGELDLPTRKRVAIARAIAFCGGVGIFCEPFAGMDDDTKALSAAALFGAYRGKTVLFATENEEDAKRFGDEILKL